MCQPAQLSTAQAYKAIGDSVTPLRLEFARKAAEIVFLVISLRYGTVAIAFSSVLAGITALVMALVPNIKILQYSIKEQIEDLMPALVMSCVMAVVVLMVGRLPLPNIALIAIQIIMGILVYLCLSVMIRPDAFIFLMKMLKHKK